MKKILLAIVLVGCSESATEVTLETPIDRTEIVAKTAVRDSVEYPGRTIKPPFCAVVPGVDINCDNYTR
jgi:hypothetical protein